MDDAAAVGRPDGLGDRCRELEEPFERQAVRRDLLFERLPLDELHHQEGERPLAVVPIDRLERVDADDSRVVERRQGLGLALEASQALRIGDEGLG